MEDIINLLDENGKPIKVKFDIKNLPGEHVESIITAPYNSDFYNTRPKEKEPEFEIKVVLDALRFKLPIPFFKQSTIKLWGISGNLGLYVAFNSGFFEPGCPIKIKLAYFAIFCAGYWESDHLQQMRPTFSFVYPCVKQVLAVWYDVVRKYRKKQTLYTTVFMNHKVVKQGISLNLRSNYIIFETVHKRNEDDPVQELSEFLVVDSDKLQRIGVYTDTVCGPIISYQTELHIVPKDMSFYVLSCTHGTSYHITAVYNKRRTLVATELTRDKAIGFLSRHVRVKRP